MSDDIFIKHGLGAFQQPYIGRASVNAQEPVISQRDARTPGNARQPGTYQHRTPGTYRLPASARTPFIRNAQTPNIRSQQEPTIKDAREPNIANARTPFIRNNQNPFTYQHRTPTIYQNSYQHQSPFTYQHQSPFITQSPRNYQVPGSYQLRTPGTYPVIAQKIVNYQHRSPAILTYRHPTTSVVQSTYQVSKNQQEPNNRSQQQPYIFSYRAPLIVTYQTTYNHQQPTTSFLPQTTVESVAEISEIITGFGANVSIPNHNDSVDGFQAGAASIYINDDSSDTYNSGESGQADAEASLFFKVAPISNGSNDYGLYVRKGLSQNDGGIGNMSSNLSSSFSYSSIGSTGSYNLIFRINNIGNGRVECKLNFPNPTASPYTINTGSGPAGWRTGNVSSSRGWKSGSNNNDNLECLPIQWPQTSVGITNNAPGQAREEMIFALNQDTTSVGGGTLSTSYQDVPGGNNGTAGLGVNFRYHVRETDQNAPTRQGISSIYEFLIRDKDTPNTVYTVDLLVAWAVSVSLEEEETGGED